MSLRDAALSALLNLVLLAGVPLLVYFSYQKLRHNRGLAESARRVGLRLGDVRFIGYCLIAAAITVVALLAWSPPLEPFMREGSPQRRYVGLGLSGQAIAMALLYGVVQTGLSEEVLFRGLIAGVLARRLPFVWANLLQALIFLAPHFLILLVMPELGWILPLVFGAALFLGWARIRSDSIVGPWILHASANVTMCLLVAARTIVVS